MISKEVRLIDNLTVKELVATLQGMAHIEGNGNGSFNIVGCS